MLCRNDDQLVQVLPPLNDYVSLSNVLGKFSIEIRFHYDHRGKSIYDHFLPQILFLFEAALLSRKMRLY